MSGYLEVKYPFRSNLGLNPFKQSWKRQWCILRPSPTFSGGILAVYCSEAGVAAGSVELPAGLVVRRAKSRSRPHAFAVFPADEPRKPRVLLAATTQHDAQLWMEKIKSLISGNNMLETEPLLKDSYSVTVNMTEFSRKCGLSGADSTVSLSPAGVLVSRSQKLGIFLKWEHVTDATLTTDNHKNATCVITVNSGFHKGGGELRLASPLAAQLATALATSLASLATSPATRGQRQFSRSEGDLRGTTPGDLDLGDVRRSSWYSGPSEVSLDDLDLIMSKDPALVPSGRLARCAGAGHLAPAADTSMSERCSLSSLSSGIYEEIADAADDVYCRMSRAPPAAPPKCVEPAGPGSWRLEPQYECVQECVSLYGTTRRPRRQPPPLPPRALHSTQKSWWAADGVTRHGSLGSLGAPVGGPVGPVPVGPSGGTKARTLPRWDRSRQAFSAFRKRLKSDSRVLASPKSDASKDAAPKKKKFEFAPTRDIFRTLRVTRKMKALNIGLNKEAKSCEHLDDTEQAPAPCSRSVDCLERDEYDLDNLDSDLDLEFDEVAALSLPREILFILDRREKMTISLNDDIESDYMPMSPIVPAPAIEHNYIVMSPRSNIA